MPTILDKKPKGTCHFEVFHTSSRSICRQKRESKRLNHLNMFSRESYKMFSMVDLLCSSNFYPKIMETKKLLCHHLSFIMSRTDQMQHGSIRFVNDICKINDARAASLSCCDPLLYLLFVLYYSSVKIVRCERLCITLPSRLFVTSHRLYPRGQNKRNT